MSRGTTLDDLRSMVGLDVAVALSPWAGDDPRLHRRALLFRVDDARAAALVNYPGGDIGAALDSQLVAPEMIAGTWAELLSRHAVRADTAAAHAAARAARRAEFDREFVLRTFSR